MPPEKFSEGKGYKVRDISTAAAGRMKIDWAESKMPVLMALRAKHSRLKSLAGMKVTGCLHVTKETAVLIETLVAAGAKISWSGCNPSGRWCRASPSRRQLPRPRTARCKPAR